MPSSRHVKQYQSVFKKEDFSSWRVTPKERDGFSADTPFYGEISKYFHRLGRSLGSHPESEDEISVGIYSDDYRDAEVFIETRDPARIQQLKALGLARGSTPTSYVTAFVGEYMQSLILEAEYYGYVTKKWKEKWEICVALQDDLRKLEYEELQLDPSSPNGFKEFQKREALREKIIARIDSALEKNEKLSLSIFSTNGDLHKQLHLARQFMWNYSFPDKRFTKADQLYMDVPSEVSETLPQGGSATQQETESVSPTLVAVPVSAPDASKPVQSGVTKRPGVLVFQASQHGRIDNQQYGALRAFYRILQGEPPKKPIRTANGWFRFGNRIYENIAVSMAPPNYLVKKDPSFTEKMWRLEKGIGERVFNALKRTVRFLPTYIKDSFRVGNYFSRQLESVKSSIYQIPPPDIQTPTPQTAPAVSGDVVVKPSQTYDPVWHDSFLARITGFLRGQVRSFEEIALQHPVAATVTMAMGAVSFMAAFNPASLNTLLVKTGMDSEVARNVTKDILKILKIDNNKSGFEKFQLAMEALIKAQALSQSVTDRDVTVVALNLLGIAETIAALSGVKWGEAGRVLDATQIAGPDMTTVHKQQSEAIRKELAKVITNANVQKAGVFGALLVQPFRFILPVLRVLFVPIAAAIYNKSLTAGWNAFKKEGKDAALEVSKAMLAGVNFLFNVIDTVTSLAFTALRVTFEAISKLIYKPLGTAGTLLEKVSDVLCYPWRYLQQNRNNNLFYKALAFIPAMVGYPLQGASYLLNQAASGVVSLKSGLINLGHAVVAVLTVDFVRLPKFLAHRMYQKVDTTAQTAVVSVSPSELSAPALQDSQSHTKKASRMSRDAANEAEIEVADAHHLPAASKIHAHVTPQFEHNAVKHPPDSEEGEVLIASSKKKSSPSSNS